MSSCEEYLWCSLVYGTSVLNCDLSLPVFFILLSSLFLNSVVLPMLIAGQQGQRLTCSRSRESLNGLHLAKILKNDRPLYTLPTQSGPIFEEVM